jgi:hypothetical protein
MARIRWVLKTYMSKAVNAENLVGCLKSRTKLNSCLITEQIFFLKKPKCSDRRAIRRGKCSMFNSQYPIDDLIEN